MSKNGMFKVKLHEHQKEVINFLRTNVISIIEAEAGTGKDFCCLYRGLDAVDTGEHSGLVLIKPIIEVGQKIGYLPGDENDKMEPYEKSFHDNIVKMVGKTSYQRLKNKIKFEPISFLRGNTFEYSTVILSEAQNCTLHELITVVTRLSHNSRLFINGDSSQSDIGNRSGLKDFIEIIKRVDGVGIMNLGEEHQVRNKIITDINKEYRNFLNQKFA